MGKASSRKRSRGPENWADLLAQPALAVERVAMPSPTDPVVVRALLHMDSVFEEAARCCNAMAGSMGGAPEAENFRRLWEALCHARRFLGPSVDAAMRSPVHGSADAVDHFVAPGGARVTVDSDGFVRESLDPALPASFGVSLPATKEGGDPPG